MKTDAVPTARERPALRRTAPDARRGAHHVSEPVSQRTTLHRYAHRAAYDRETVDAILDEGIVCHVGVTTDQGFPVVIPLAYGRVGDNVYLHGSAASRLFRRSRQEGIEICMTVTFVDGVVVARSTYNTDINYRSVVIIGSACEVRDLDEKRLGLDAMVEHIIPGRTLDARAPTEKELRATMLLKLPLAESSAKVRTGFPLDEEEDYELAVWAGVVPLTVRVEPPLADPALRIALEPPDYVTGYRRVPARSAATGG
jgi:nitroimidazol reductase NimA-like FMN-containing flavoprotein (pyridoxamine 5'-phosphate oxidase superfamily)